MFLLGLAACATAGFDGQVYRGEGFAFRVEAIPPSWQRLEHSHAALAFRDPAHQAIVMINARCGIDSEDIPLQALTHHLFLQFTERTIHGQTMVPLDDREAMHTEMDAKLDGVPMAFDAWVMKKDGCVYDLVYFAPTANFDNGKPMFQSVVQSFATVPAERP